MDLWVNIKVALRALMVNKVRSFLTILGIIIGVCAVIAMIVIGNGAKAKLAESIESIGSNLLMVRPGSRTSGGTRMGMGTHLSLTLDDAIAIGEECSAVKMVAPIVRGTAQVVYGNENWNTIVMGTFPEIFAIREWEIDEGKFFTYADVEGATKRCVIGKTVADNLFFGENPVGKTIRINRVLFKVIGTLKMKGQSLMGQDQDDIIYIPLTTAQQRVFGSLLPGVINLIMVKAVSQNKVDDAEEQINNLLLQRHNIGKNKEPDFLVMNFAEMTGIATKAANISSILLGAIASISLLVGGIGIMNIMLVSVTERTREIGIRMAIGAKQRDILLQFLMESVVLSFIGGVIGTIFGIAISVGVSNYFDWPTIISPFAIILAFGFSAGVGIFFGFYPAKRASSLNPIDALRYE
ncbi:MAG: FtsX-like permease family protein [Candidatus Schekmanbacteria bacterium]|nr:MAG: FtsX-like permease family protein [Candidatus Schekmanbacteria bacterium]